MKTLATILCILSLSAALAAQTEQVQVVQEFFGPAPQAVSIPVPKLDSRTARVGGTISVTIEVGTNGSVTVIDVNGPHPICKSTKDPRVLAARENAVAAAEKSRFSPPIVDAVPTTAKGRLNYDFGPISLIVPHLAQVDDPTTGTVERSSGQVGAGAVVATGGNQKPLPGAVLNGRATLLAKPTYPAAAKAVKAGGAVNLQVLIDEDGTMYMATANSGHPLLRRSSEIAACSSTFQPTLLNGVPVKVSGVLTYNFVP